MSRPTPMRGRQAVLQEKSNVLCLLLALVHLAVPVAAQTTGAGTNKITYGAQAEGRMLVLGCVTNQPKFNYGRMQGIAEYVLARMGDEGLSGVEVFTVDSAEKMTRLLRDGRVDWVSATPYSAVTYMDQANAEILLAKEQYGEAWYHAVFFARNDSGIKTFDDLLGKTIAFEKPSSTSAYFVPAAILRQAGVRLVQLDSVRDKPPSDAVGYLFSGDESNSSIWVHKGIVDAAAFSDRDWSSDWIMPGSFREDLSVFHRSSEIPRSVEVVRSGLPESLKTRLQDILLAAPDDPDAAPALKNYYHATGFHEIDDDIRLALDNIRGGMQEFNPAGD